MAAAGTKTDLHPSWQRPYRSRFEKGSHLTSVQKESCVSQGAKMSQKRENRHTMFSPGNPALTGWRVAGTLGHLDEQGEENPQMAPGENRGHPFSLKSRLICHLKNTCVAQISPLSTRKAVRVRAQLAAESLHHQSHIPGLSVIHQPEDEEENGLARAAGTRNG